MRTKFQLLALVAGAPLLFAQGPLTPPPGAPAPTMKTLDQIEPRTPLVAGSPGVNTTDAAYHFVISQPGSYYLTANLPVTKANGIRVTVAGVTVDLRGLQIHRASGSGGDGITVDPVAHRCTVRDGSLASFFNGIQSVFDSGYAEGGSLLQVSVSGCSSGLVTGAGWQIEGCEAHDNAFYGIYTNVGCTLTSCTASGNRGLIGIFANNGCTLTNCTASGNESLEGIRASGECTLSNCTAYANRGSYGIHALDSCTLNQCTADGNQVTAGIFATHGCTLSHCTASYNTDTTASSFGIITGHGCTIVACTAFDNRTTAASSSNSTGGGISTDAGCTIKDCTVKDNRGAGILVTGSCRIADNTVTNNGNGNTGTNGDGIATTATDNRIEGNNASFNKGYGIRSSSANADVIIRNTSFNNHGTAGTGTTANYNPSTGTYFGPLSTPASATSPWANF
jgi:parallel beta-helix repeat protein